MWAGWLSASSHPFPTSSVIVLCALGCCVGIRGANEGAKAKATPLTIQGGLEEGWQRQDPWKLLTQGPPPSWTTLLLPIPRTRALVG